MSKATIFEGRKHGGHILQTGKITPIQFILQFYLFSFCCNVIKQVMFLIMTLLRGIVVLLLSQYGSSQLSVVDSRISNCDEVRIPSDFLTTYIGWPYEISCNWFLTGDDYNLYDLYSYNEDLFSTDNELLCDIWSENGTLLFNSTVMYESLEYGIPSGLHLDDLQQSSSLQFTMTLRHSRLKTCLFSEVLLRLIPFEQISCQEFIQNETRPTAFDFKQDFKLFDCSEASRTFPKIVSTQEGLYKWERNCSDLPVGTQKNNENKLLIPSVKYDHAGFYTCSVTYKGMKRYIVKKPICVVHDSTVNNPSLTCMDPNLEGNRGESVTFACTGNLGKGDIDPNIFYFTLKKLLPNGTTTMDIVTHCKFEEKTSKDRVSCQYTFRKPTCFLSIATEEEREERQNADSLIPVTFTIKNLTDNDYGVYILELVIILSESEKANVTLRVSPNPVPSLLTTATIAGIGVGAVCFLAVFLLIISYNMLVLRVYLKRYCGDYLPDNKKYGAFLCYNFSQDIDTFAQQDVRRAMWEVRSSLERLGYKVYDERREGSTQESRAENIRLSIERSHRVVILLSLEFIKDGWSMLALQAGFDEMIKSGSRLILILLPGIKEYIKQHQKDDEACLMIQTAVKLNYAIPWSSKKSFNKKRFNLRIEDAMPKLKSQKLSRMMSTSSNGDISLGDFVEFDIHNFQRCFSNETDITDIDIPRSHCDVLRNIDEQQVDPSNAVV